MEITRQGWLGALPESDLCSHGDLRLVIGGETIATGDGGEFGISEGALALLRTLESDHSPESPVAERLIPDGCGAILMLGCPIGIDWSVRRIAGRVRLGDVVRHDGLSVAASVSFPGVVVELAEDEYRSRVVAFARTAKALFDGVEKTPEGAFDRAQSADFWREYDSLLDRAGR